MTPPALYRYVPSLAGLNDLVSRAIAADVSARITEAADRQTEPAARLVAAATAFRQWALNNYAEYRAAFAPQDGPLATPTGTPSATETASTSFAKIFQEVVAAYDTPALAAPSVPDQYLQTFAQRGEASPTGPVRRISAEDELFERAWVKFLGVISYETFGFLDPDRVVSGELFVNILLEIGAELGLIEEMDRLVAIAVETAIWTDEVDGVQPLHVQRSLADSE